jgi:hypothetical protein
MKFSCVLSCISSCNSLSSDSFLYLITMGFLSRFLRTKSLRLRQADALKFLSIKSNSSLVSRMCNHLFLPLFFSSIIFSFSLNQFHLILKFHCQRVPSRGAARFLVVIQPDILLTAENRSLKASKSLFSAAAISSEEAVIPIKN